jgi:geranylgeranyl reductase family protein
LNAYPSSVSKSPNEARQYDVIIVGAGIAGSRAALETVENGSSVLILEEHKQVGVPSHCSGVVSLNGLKLIGIEPHQSFTQRMIYGAKFHPPNGETVEVRKSDPVAVIINRARFDQYSAKQALSKGAVLETNVRVSKWSNTNSDIVSVTLSDGTFRSGKVLIDASGAGSRLPEQAGLKTPDWNQLLPGLQYELNGTSKQDDMVDLYFGSNKAPGFFAWNIPTGDHTARIGLATRKGNVKVLLDNLVAANWPGSTIESTKSGSVLVSGPIEKCWSQNFLVVGDAAGQVKQTTGGGIVIGGYCGILAGRAASKAAKTESRERSKYLYEYDQEWRGKFANDLRKMGLAHKLVSGLSDDTINRLFQALGEDVGDIVQFGDMDFQGEIISRMLKNRKLVATLPRVALDSVRSIFA